MLFFSFQKSTLYVDGAYRVWLRSSQVTYFVLRGHVTPKRPKEANYDDTDLSKIRTWTHGQVFTTRYDHCFYGKINIFSVKSTFLLKKLLKLYKELISRKFFSVIALRFIVLFHTVRVELSDFT